jgi:hypothetical protein
MDGRTHSWRGRRWYGVEVLLGLEDGPRTVVGVGLEHHEIWRRHVAEPDWCDADYRFYLAIGMSR